MLITALLFVFGAAQTNRPAPVVVTGCLTASTVQGQEQFTLTTRDTNRTTPDIKTLTYQLNPTGNVDLKSMVGHRVEATGTEAVVGAEATTVDSTRATENRAAGTSGRTPTVETKTHADIVVHVMNVTTAKPVAGDCRVP